MADSGFQGYMPKSFGMGGMLTLGMASLDLYLDIKNKGVLGKLGDDVKKFASGVTTTFNKMNETLEAGTTTAGTAMAAFGASIQGLVGPSTMLAARNQVLHTTMINVGKSAGKTASEVDSTMKSIKKLGITTSEASSSTVRFMQAQMDLKKASQLARAAQDLAIVTGENSSEVYGKLIDSVVSFNTLTLNQYGLLKNLNTIMDEYAATQKKTADMLTEREAKEAMLTYILKEATKVQGSYASAMQDVYKMQSSLVRIKEEAMASFGEQFLAPFTVVTKATKDLLESYTSLDEESQSLIAKTVKWGAVLSEVGARTIAYTKEQGGIVTMLMNVVGALGTAGTAIFTFNTTMELLAGKTGKDIINFGSTVKENITGAVAGATRSLMDMGIIGEKTAGKIGNMGLRAGLSVDKLSEKMGKYLDAGLKGKLLTSIFGDIHGSLIHLIVDSDNLVKSSGKASKGILKFGADIVGVDDILRFLSNNLKEVGSLMGEMGNAAFTLGGAGLARGLVSKEFANSLFNVKTSLDVGGKSLGNYTLNVNNYKKAVEKAQAIQEKWAGAKDNLEKLKEVKGDIDKLKDSMKGWAEENKNALGWVSKWKTSLTEMIGTKLPSFARGLGIVAVAMAALAAIIKPIYDDIKKADKVVEESNKRLQDSMAGVMESGRNYNAMLQITIDYYGDLAKAADKLGYRRSIEMEQAVKILDLQKRASDLRATIANKGKPLSAAEREIDTGISSDVADWFDLGLKSKGTNFKMLSFKGMGEALKPAEGFIKESFLNLAMWVKNNIIDIAELNKAKDKKEDDYVKNKKRADYIGLGPRGLAILNERSEAEYRSSATRYMQATNEDNQEKFRKLIAAGLKYNLDMFSEKATEAGYRSVQRRYETRASYEKGNFLRQALTGQPIFGAATKETEATRKLASEQVAISMTKQAMIARELTESVKEINEGTDKDVVNRKKLLEIENRLSDAIKKSNQLRSHSNSLIATQVIGGSKSLDQVKKELEELVNVQIEIKAGDRKRIDKAVKAAQKKGLIPEGLSTKDTISTIDARVIDTRRGYEEAKKIIERLSSLAKDVRKFNVMRNIMLMDPDSSEEDNLLRIKGLADKNMGVVMETLRDFAKRNGKFFVESAEGVADMFEDMAASANVEEQQRAAQLRELYNTIISDRAAFQKAMQAKTQALADRGTSIVISELQRALGKNKEYFDTINNFNASSLNKRNSMNENYFSKAIHLINKQFERQKGSIEHINALEDIQQQKRLSRMEILVDHYKNLYKYQSQGAQEVTMSMEKSFDMIGNLIGAMPEDVARTLSHTNKTLAKKLVPSKDEVADVLKSLREQTIKSAQDSSVDVEKVSKEKNIKEANMANEMLNNDKKRKQKELEEGEATVKKLEAIRNKYYRKQGGSWFRRFEGDKASEEAELANIKGGGQIDKHGKLIPGSQQYMGWESFSENVRGQTAIIEKYKTQNNELRNSIANTDKEMAKNNKTVAQSRAEITLMNKSFTDTGKGIKISDDQLNKFLFDMTQPGGVQRVTKQLREMGIAGGESTQWMKEWANMAAGKTRAGTSMKLEFLSQAEENLKKLAEGGEITSAALVKSLTEIVDAYDDLIDKTSDDESKNQYIAARDSRQQQLTQARKAMVQEQIGIEGEFINRVRELRGNDLTEQLKAFDIVIKAAGKNESQRRAWIKQRMKVEEDARRQQMDTVRGLEKDIMSEKKGGAFAQFADFFTQRKDLEQRLKESPFGMSKLKEWEDVMKGKLKKDYESNQPQQDQTYSGFQLVGGFSNIGSDFESLFQEAKNYANSFDSQLKTQFGFEDSLTKSERVVREFTEELARAGTSLGSFAKDVEQTFRYRSGDLRTTQEAGGSIGAYGQVTNNYNTLYMPTNATNEVKEVMTQGVMLYAQSNSNYASNAAQPIPMSPAMQKPQLMGGSRVTTNVNMSASSSYSNHVSQLKPNSAPPPSLKTNTNASIIRPNKPSKLSQNNELNSLGDDFVDRS